MPILDKRSPARDSRLFWRYWTASTTSSVGSAVTQVALPLIAVSALHRSAFDIGLLAAAGFLGWLLIGLPAGVIAERFPLRGLQVSMDLARAVAMLSVPVAWWLGHLTFGHLLAVALVIGFANVLFDVANSAFLPSLIDSEELTSRNSLISGSYAVTQTGGPSLGGLLVQLIGPVAALGADFISYLTSAAILLRLPYRAPVPVDTRASSRALIAQGWAFVRNHSVMFPSMLWATAVNLTTGGLLALTPVYLVRQVGAPAGVVGLLIATDGIGALLGSLVATRLATRFGTARALILASVTGSTVALLIPFTVSQAGVGYFIAGNVAFGAGVVVGSILTRTHRQTSSPPELLARVMATVRFVSWGAVPVGAVLAGAISSAAGLRPAMAVVCVSALAAPAILLLSPLRGRHDLADAR